VTASSTFAASPSVLLDGSRGERTELLQLSAGPLSLRFEEGGLRYVRWGEREVVRRVYCAVRDANWGTVPDQITNLDADIRDDSFRIEFDVENRQAEIDFTWHGTITGEVHAPPPPAAPSKRSSLLQPP
jgi:D-apionolactonase